MLGRGVFSRQVCSVLEEMGRGLQLNLGKSLWAIQIPPNALPRLSA